MLLKILTRNWVRNYKIVKEFKEFFEFGRFADQLGFFKDWEDITIIIFIFYPKTIRQASSITFAISVIYSENSWSEQSVIHSRSLFSD